MVLFCLAGWTDESWLDWCWCLSSQPLQDILHSTWRKWSRNVSHWSQETLGTILAFPPCGKFSILSFLIINNYQGINDDCGYLGGNRRVASPWKGWAAWHHFCSTLGFHTNFAHIIDIYCHDGISGDLQMHQR